MPGLNQLKQFATDLLNLGDEVKIRAARGEKPVTVPIPKDITIDDDSEDFKLGMPQLSEEEEQQAQALAEERNREANDFSDITGEGSGPDSSDSEEPISMAMPDVSDLLAGADSTSLDDLDLSDFVDEPEEEEEPEEPEETPLEDMDLDALLTPSNPSADLFADDDEDEFQIPTEPQPIYRTGRLNPHKMEHKPSASDMEFEALMGQASSLESVPEADSVTEEIQDPFDGIPDDLGNNDFGTPSAEIDMNEDIPAEFNEKPAENVPDSSVLDSFDVPSVPDFETGGSDLDLPDFDENGLASSAGIDTEPAASGPTISLTDDEIETKGESSVLDGSETPDFSEDDTPLETFDTSAMEGMDFSEPGAVSTGMDDGFSGMDLSDDDFEIPNFTGPAVSEPEESFSKKDSISTPDFSDAEEDEKNKPKNTFTDAEYRLFRKNLSEYPLNLRLAIEDMVVKNEFKDDNVYAILEKVLRKVPARQLASQLDKEMDIHVEVPRDYERRTAEEYEIYKQSLEYKLKNRIIPFAIITAAAAILICCIGYLTWTLAWKPLRAEHFYKQGYAQIQENLYPQSEESFSMAVRNKAKKNWFYKYAESYRDHHQYERARVIYKHSLSLFKHDKKSGLDWARMEQEDLYAYAEAERVLKREVLDYHINDPEALLQLGDLYLEWADEEDPTKYEDAKAQYDWLVVSNPKSKLLNLYNAREMRYYVHVDDLQQVIQYKNMFYPDNLKSLDSRDLTELSGYLLDKRYGTLRPSEEHLRSYISDLKDLLEKAVKKDPSNPTALYNMGRYSVVTSAYKNAEAMYKASIDAFKEKNSRTKKETRTFVDAYRLLGEQYVDQKEFILAQQTYNDGIDLFEKENRSSGFESTKDVGVLYSDLGDVNYFINGDMDAALDNYQKAIANKNDCAPVRYKVGYINYINRDYDEAWDSFVNGNELSNGEDEHTLLALANTLAIKDDYFAACGYYKDLLDVLKDDFNKYNIVLPHARADHADLVDTYMKATNNLGVTLSRLANLNGDSDVNGDAFVNFSESSRAWDVLTRNQETMVRVTTKNLANQNSTYVANPSYGFEPTIYTEIPKAMYGEEGLKIR